jgi:hypothetical protein
MTSSSRTRLFSWISIVAVVLFSLLGGCRAGQQQQDASFSGEVMYLTLVIHAEEDYQKDPDTGEIVKDPAFPDFLEKSQFDHFSRAMRELAGVFHQHNARINFETDWTFVEGVVRWDPTFFADLEAMGHEIDAHAHETTVTYPELWQRIGNAGGNPSPVVGGFLYTSDWSDKFNGFDGIFQILWGAASQAHLVDYAQPGYAYRPWRENWLIHDPEQRLIYIGPNAGVSDAGDAGRSLLDEALFTTAENRVNTYSLFDATGSFLADEGVPDIPAQFTAPYGDAKNWRTRIEAWDAWLASVADAYAASGRIEWKKLTEVGGIYIEFERRNQNWWESLQHPEEF